MLRVFTQSLKVVTIAALSVMVLATGVWAFSYAAELARPSDTGEASDAHGLRGSDRS